MRVSYRHCCSVDQSVHCTRGNGRPRRKRCAYCGSSLSVEAGTWGVFEWRGDGRYMLTDVISTHPTEAQARKVADATNTLVVRFIT